MTPSDYASLCKNIGTQTQVAALLGRSVECVSRRCRGRETITTEASLAIRFLAGTSRCSSCGKKNQQAVKTK